jgi:hypothetical protein
VAHAGATTGHAGAVVVCLSPFDRLTPARAGAGRAIGSRVDAVVVADVALLLEVKLREPCDARQIGRHADHWALRLRDPDPAAWPVTGPADGVAPTTWRTLGGWLAREVRRDGSAPELAALAKTLRGSDLIAMHPAVATAPSARPVPVDTPEAVDLAEIAAGVSLAAVARAAADLDGTQGGWRVSSTGCAADAARVA